MEKHIEKGLDHKNLGTVTTKYNSNYRKYRHEMIDEPKKTNRIFIHKKLGAKVIMNCRTTAAHKYRTKLGFKHNVIFIKEQSVLT